ncbi:putative GTPase activating protein for Arf-domain-containing protein [Fimicolochytrium jonesii]|uniref:putative GTPase activating protein for Arf-domain-containing protein n=1 Tax=Fimicolochytrium jonesii TaxID=1396493 RepID=UPI0022FE3D49|nr:putative GTPase activating protein for Arf-domain-containing protein [Fimicolochytrium jonesii]KAI8822115.1 putative GTPase activating protein for Arf-domain-containing protein [Fimicolochytrium jonesii]
MSTQLSERDKKKRDEANVKILQELLTLPDNQCCADCNERGPRWASTNHGVFLCIRCGGLHRKLGTHISKIKSITLDSWTPEQITHMKEWGNRKANEKLLAGGAPPAPAHSDQEMEQYIRNKYEKRNFETSGGANQSVNMNLSRDANTYASQLRTLQGMGFTDQIGNLGALKRANGNMDKTVEYLLAKQSSSSPSGSASQPSRDTSRSTTSAPAPRQQAQTQPGGRSPAMQAALKALEAMGFHNEDENIQALAASNGQVETAANKLLDLKNRRGPSQPSANSASNAQPVIPPRNDSSTPNQFVLEPPSSSKRAVANRQQAAGDFQTANAATQQAAPSNDPFGGFGADLFAPPVAADQQQQQAQQGFSQSSASLIPPPSGTNLAPQQPKGVAKDSIMSLFNQPVQNQQGMFGGMGQQMGGFGGNVGYGNPMQGGFQGAQGGQFNNYGGGPPQQSQQQVFQNQFQQQQQAVRAGNNPFAPQQQQQQWGQQQQFQQQPQQQQFGYHGQFQPQQQQQLYAYGPGQGQAIPRTAHDLPFGASSQQQQQPLQAQKPQQPDPFADLGPSFNNNAVTQGQAPNRNQAQNSFF